MPGRHRPGGLWLLALPPHPALHFEPGSRPSPRHPAHVCGEHPALSQDSRDSHPPLCPKPGGTNGPAASSLGGTGPPQQRQQGPGPIAAPSTWLPCTGREGKGRNRTEVPLELLPGEGGTLADPSHRAEVPTQHLAPNSSVSVPATTPATAVTLGCPHPLEVGSLVPTQSCWRSCSGGRASRTHANTGTSPGPPSPARGLLSQPHQHPGFIPPSSISPSPR